MQTIKTANGDVLFIPDARELGGKIASLDLTGWVSLSWIGGGDAYLIDKDEWPDFVDFINEINESIINQQSMVPNVELTSAPLHEPNKE